MFVSIPDCFMISLIIGLIMGFVYEAFRIIRIILPFRVIIFLCDVAFFVVSANVVMALSEHLGSYIRIYTVTGYGAGIFSYIVTLGRIFNIAENAVSNVWRTTLKKIGTAFRNLLSKLFRNVAHKIKIIVGKNADYRAEKEKNNNMLLNLNNEMMYNKERLDKNGGKANVIKASVRKDIRTS